MLGDKQIMSLDTHLERFKLQNQVNQTDLQKVLVEYSQVLEQNKELKKAFDKKEIGNGNNIPAEKPRNPYILVLVDGNGYIFNDELVSEKEEGGMKAARMLNGVVEKQVGKALLEACDNRIVVRIYADVTGLSKLLAKSKLVGLEKRSLAAFAAGFTRTMGLFDFVDALDEEGTRFKIKEMFKLAAEDSNCDHILYAACHDTSYLSLMVPYSGMKNKITLVQSAGFSSEFLQFSLNVTQFPTVFRWSELPSVALSSAIKSNGTHSDRIVSPSKSAKAPREQMKSQPVHSADTWNNPDAGFGTDEPSSAGSKGWGESNGSTWGTAAESSKQQGQVTCKYFQKGFCRYGKNCKFQHSPSGSSKTANGKQPPLNGAARSNISSSLPPNIPPNYIPLNKDNQRIDTYIKAPTQSEWAIYNERFHRQKPCNAFHLQGDCTTFNCPYDHNDLEPEAHHCLKYVLKCSPCPRKGACRAADCFHGHICQKDECVGQIKGCKMKMDLHNVDPKMASLVPATENLAHEEEGADPSACPLIDIDGMGTWEASKSRTDQPWWRGSM
ncbi:uncharacterized protein BDR25DRAFT_290224 [Lindgomyces ingoldianus]|uniref:Uncharacterized protein n=1 Tax=Lindgomyces ingoldianus TaxID=673940 RepID=A0ACB6QNM2_9PLEO|nr:uncharacterized protein BDR25DRAFT_290224 [Lindgomyces ingoldianus]KAF2468511.1 hypothetical protein BDR25DRAFT_290224 [Lindgomyces ingoldianus]